MAFYNTTNEQGEQLTLFRNKAATQEDMILEFFMEKGKRKYSPSMVHFVLFDRATPLTSVRRAMTNLTNAGRLVKTGVKSEGNYGRKEYHWQLAGEELHG